MPMTRSKKKLITILAVASVIAVAAYVATRTGRQRSAPATAHEPTAEANRQAGTTAPNTGASRPSAPSPSVSVNPTPPAPGSSAVDAAEWFRRGERTVEANLGDAVDATREGLERGIADLQEALRLGYPQRKAALTLIAQAYVQIASGYVRNGSAEQMAAFAQAAAAYREVVALDPSNVGLRLSYAALMDPAERRRQYEEAVRIAPDDGRAQFALGRDLLGSGDTARGARHLLAAVERFTPSELSDYGSRAVGELRYAGLEAEAAKAEAVIKARTGGSQ